MPLSPYQNKGIAILPTFAKWGAVAEFATAASEMSTISVTSWEWLFFMGYLTIATCGNLRKMQIALLFSHFSEARKMEKRKRRPA